MKRRVVITGFGVNCAAGRNKEEFYENLRNNVTGVSKCDLFDCSKLASDKFGEIKDINKDDERNRAFSIIEALVDELFLDTGLNKEYFKSLGRRCQLSFATSLGINHHVTGYARKELKGEQDVDLLPTMVSSMTDLIAKRMNIRGGYYVNSAACTAGTTAIGTAYSKIIGNHADAVVTCSVDPLTEFSAYGFFSLNNMSSGICRPFDKDHDGLTLGEGGAIFLLEDYECAKARNAKIYCEVIGYGIGNDAYHPTSPDPTGNGAYRTIKMAVEGTKYDLTDVDYINMHGTGTLHNDTMEVILLHKFEPFKKTLYINSIKSYIGHCLAAGGGIEMAATILSLVNGEIFPTHGLENFMDDMPGVEAVKNKTVQTQISLAMSNSYAFAGNSATVLVGQV